MVFRRNIALAHGDGHLRLDGTFSVEMGQYQLGIQNLDIGRTLDIRRAHHFLTGNVETNDRLIAFMKFDFQLLEVEQNIVYILFNTRQGRKFMQNIIYLHFDNRCTLEAREENPAQGIAQGKTKPSFKWLRSEFTVSTRQGFFFNLDPSRFDE